MTPRTVAVGWPSGDAAPVPLVYSNVNRTLGPHPLVAGCDSELWYDSSVSSDTKWIIGTVVGAVVALTDAFRFTLDSLADR